MVIGSRRRAGAAVRPHEGRQDVAFEAIRPGARCSDVDKAVRTYFAQHELFAYWRHHTGHAIGLRYHEGPFLDSGDHTEIRPGMVFTVEPRPLAPTSAASATRTPCS
jgi:Xaa-Pro aminopeptidase